MISLTQYTRVSKLNDSSDIKVKSQLHPKKSSILILYSLALKHRITFLFRSILSWQNVSNLFWHMDVSGSAPKKEHYASERIWMTQILFQFFKYSSNPQRQQTISISLKFLSLQWMGKYSVWCLSNHLNHIKMGYK